MAPFALQELFSIYTKITFPPTAKGSLQKGEEVSPGIPKGRGHVLERTGW